MGCYRTPMGTYVKLTKDENGSSVDPILYRSMIDSLLYLTTSSPDIWYSIRVWVGVCVRYQANPKKSYLAVVKRIIRYINGTINFGILNSKDIKMNLVGFCDADWAENADKM